ncbi:MAG TPA: DNA polymerase III subunit alpha [Stenotrophobium sp.]|jgi:DNA polymerase-3 subunit alpha|nr:DNA polymerase III subunit alpha [Stenotrophobium sp.]
MSFVHLRLHTEYSLSDGLVRLEPPKRKGGGTGMTLTERAAELQLPAVAITDRNNLFAMVKFYKAAEAAGIKPVIGADIWLEERQPGEGPERLTLLVQDETGYRNLTRLISQGYTDGQATGYPLIQRSWLREASDGLIALSGRDGGICRALLGEHAQPALAALAELQALFPKRLYLEIARCQRADDEAWVQAALLLARHADVPLVATNDVRFLTREDFFAHEARVCIAQGRVLNDEKRPRDYTEEQYLKSAQEMQALFADIPEAIANTLEIARRCNISLKFGTHHLPQFPVPETYTTDSWLREQARIGLDRRLETLHPVQPLEVYRQRLDYELGIIEKMGFAGYFLVVADFIHWAKHNGCPVGPGRGSGAGSLVAYAIGITDLDPLPYNLLFERFLNPERVSLPDFDVDFCMDNRDRVIEYVTQKYGRSHVGQIITYSTMAARGVVRDVVRVMGHGYGFGDTLAKLIPGVPGATLADALDEIPELKQRYRDEDDTRQVLDLALALEGVTRGVGVHAGGVVIAPEALTDYAPLYCKPGGESMVTQFDMKDLESVGLVKFDFLGLKTLTVIATALENIRKSRGERIDMLGLPLDDSETYKVYAAGATTAVFQMESPGMQRAATDLRPDTFEDIIALVSLYRPGPMELIPEYCARKRGDAKVEYLHPDMEPVLQPTYGIFVYQEQVMQMSQRLAGYTLGGADLLRRAMGKKIAAEMAKQRVVFTEGAVSQGVQPEIAAQVFDLMEKFANYGFNKSHAAAYALVSYHTCWLKTHYPAEFMAAVMSCDMDHTETVVTMLDECRRMNLDVRPPDINRSHFKFTVPPAAAGEATRQILYGLGAIKGAGAAALEGILAERESHGAFTDLFDFCRRIDTRKANKRVLEALIFSGALDGFGLNRASLLATLPKALALAEKAAESADSGQVDLFGLGAAGDASISEQIDAEIVSDWPARERLNHERETLGFYLSGHPIEAYADCIEQICSGRLRELIGQYAVPPPPPQANGKRAWQPRAKVMFAAWVTDLRFFKGDKSTEGKAGRASYKVTLDDKTAQISTWVDTDKWFKVQSFVRVDSLVFVIAEIGMSAAREDREPEPRLYNAEFLDPGVVLPQYARQIRLDWRRPAGEVATLQKALAPYRDAQGTPVTLDYHNGKVMATLHWSADWCLRAQDECLAVLQRFMGENCVKVQYRRYQPPAPKRRPDGPFNGGNFDDE